MEIENVMETQQPVAPLSFVDFFDRNKAKIDLDKDGVFEKQELVESFGEKLASDKDTKILNSLMDNFKEVQELDSMFSSTVSRNDLLKLDGRMAADKIRTEEAAPAMDYLRENFNELMQRGNDGIYLGDLTSRVSKLNTPEVDKALNYLIVNFDKIASCSEKEMWFWQSNKISKADLRQYERSLSDNLVNSVRLLAGDDPDWIPRNVFLERNRLNDYAEGLKGWTDAERKTLRNMGYAMIEGDLDQLSEAVRSVKPQEDLKYYASALDDLWNVKIDLCRGYKKYHVAVGYRAQDAYSENKPSLAFHIKDGFWLHVPADENVKPTGWVQEKKGLFTTTWEERDQPPELVASYLSKDVRYPEVYIPPAPRRRILPPPPPGL